MRFVGHTHFKEGVWIRVELERQKGKNDGSTDQQRYFTISPPWYTVFVPVRKVALFNEEEEESKEKEEKEEKWREERAILHRDEEEEGEEVDVLQTETELLPEPHTFSATYDLLTSSMSKFGQHVLVAGAERGIVKFVSHTHFKEGV